MPFEEALDLLRAGLRLTRKAWVADKKYILCLKSPEEDELPFIYESSIEGPTAPWQPDSSDFETDDWGLVL